MAKKRNNATKRGQGAPRSKPTNRPTSNFFSKFYQRIICNKAYKDVVSWNVNGLLLIKDVKALEQAVHKEEVCSRRYDSIARQLRLYGFNRLTRRDYFQRYAHKLELPTGCFAWQHESLSNSSTLEEIVAFERKARSRSKCLQQGTAKRILPSLIESSQELISPPGIASRVQIPLPTLTAIPSDTVDVEHLHDILAKGLDTLEPEQTRHVDDVGENGRSKLAHLQDASCGLFWHPEFTLLSTAPSSEVAEAAPSLRIANDALSCVNADQMGELRQSMDSSRSSLETDSNESESSFEELFEAIQDVARSDSTHSVPADEMLNPRDEPASTFTPFSFDLSAESTTVRFWATLVAEKDKGRRLNDG